MTRTPRAPWTPEQDKELRALVLSANSVDTIAQALNRTICGTPPGKPFGEGEGEIAGARDLSRYRSPTSAAFAPWSTSIGGRS
jgi:hypothetical protein